MMCGICGNEIENVDEALMVDYCHGHEIFVHKSCWRIYMMPFEGDNRLIGERKVEVSINVQGGD